MGIYNEFANLDGDVREQYLLQQLLNDRVPSWINKDYWKPVVIAKTIANKQYELTFYCLPDYLAIGDDSDWFRVPLYPATAQVICDKWNCILPSTQMVDAIWNRATVKLVPNPLPPDNQMFISARWKQHEDIINSVKFPQTNLIAGHKKDVVIGPKLDNKHVAIYGWHQPNGNPLQPYFTGHHSKWADYSHGIRLINQRAYLNDKEINLVDLFQDQEFSILVSNQGAFKPLYPNI